MSHTGSAIARLAMTFQVMTVLWSQIVCGCLCQAICGGGWGPTLCLPYHRHSYPCHPYPLSPLPCVTGYICLDMNCFSSVFFLLISSTVMYFSFSFLITERRFLWKRSWCSSVKALFGIVSVCVCTLINK